MPYFIFNIAVAAALIYLVTGGNLPVEGLIDRVSENVSERAAPRDIPASERIDPQSEAVRKAVAEAVAEMRRDTEAREAARPAPMAEPEPVAKPVQAEPETKLPPVTETKQVAAAPKHLIDEAKAKPLDRRGETFPAVAAGEPDEAAPPPVRIEAGAALMSPSDRLRELQALTDDLELMYLERRGG